MGLEHFEVKDGKLVTADAEKALCDMLHRQQRQIDALDEDNIDFESNYEALQEFGMWLYVGITHDLTAVAFDVFPIRQSRPYLGDGDFSVHYHRNITITDLSDPAYRQSLIESFNKELAKDFESGRVDMLCETDRHITELHEKALEYDDMEEFIMSDLGKLVSAYRKADRFGESVTVTTSNSKLDFTVSEIERYLPGYEGCGRPRV